MAGSLEAGLHHALGGVKDTNLPPNRAAERPSSAYDASGRGCNNNMQTGCQTVVQEFFVMLFHFFALKVRTGPEIGTAYAA